MTTTARRPGRATAAGKQSRREKLNELTEKLEQFKAQTDPALLAAMIAKYVDNYSENNSMLIAMQCPTATEVHGYAEWQKLGRQVRKGETSIVITAYAGVRETEKGDKPRFRAAGVFDIAQTDPIPGLAEMTTGGEADDEYTDAEIRIHIQEGWHE